MSRYIATRAIRGAHAIVDEFETLLNQAIAAKGEATSVAFPNTAYYLPFYLAMTGCEAANLGDLKGMLAVAKGLLKPVPPESRWTPYLGETLDAGMATLFAEEGIEAVRFVLNQQPELLPGFHLAGGTSFTSPEFQAQNGGGHLNGPIDDI